MRGVAKRAKTYHRLTGVRILQRRRDATEIEIAGRKLWVPESVIGAITKNYGVDMDEVAVEIWWAKAKNLI